MSIANAQLAIHQVYFHDATLQRGRRSFQFERVDVKVNRLCMVFQQTDELRFVLGFEQVVEHLPEAPRMPR